VSAFELARGDDIPARISGDHPAGESAALDWPIAFVRTDGPGPIGVVRNEVRIYDTDASGLIFYGSTTRFFSDAQMVLFRHLGYRPDFEEGSSTVVRSSQFELRAPLHMGDVFESEAWVSTVGRTSIATGHRVTCQDRVCLVGTTTFVHVSIHTMRPSPLPAELAAVTPLGNDRFDAPAGGHRP
jgi:YbgC/YbaW family acyl-CoA thioester hydrolase